MSRVVLVDSGGSNISSVQNALQRLGVDAPLSSDPEVIGAAERVVLPGVGTAAQAMQRLQQLGLVACLRALQQPLLGICVGMQLLFERSDEGDVECLGRLPGTVRRLTPAPGIRIPHIGWNRLERTRSSPLLDGIADDARVYFVHSYCADVDASCVAQTSHGRTFAALVQHGNVSGAQFHPERSAAVGARLLENFIR